MKIQCPHCGVKGTADDSYHGQKLKCPKCQGIFDALSIIAETSLPDPLPSPPLVEEPVVPDALTRHAIAEDAVEASHQLPDTADDIFAADSVAPAEDLADIYAANDTSDDDKSPITTKPSLVVEPEEVLDWADIASEIDKELVDDSKRGREENQEPAMLHDFFENAAPTVDMLSPPAGKQGDEKVFEATTLAGDEPPAVDTTPHITDLAGMQEAGESLDTVERQPYGMDKEQCWQCGKKDSVGVPFIAKDGRLYCSDCLPADKPEQDELGAIPTALAKNGAVHANVSPEEPRYSFTIGGLLQEAWAKTKGVKATVWAGSAVMYLALLVLAAAGVFLLPSQSGNSHGLNIPGLLGDMLFPLVTNAVSVIFSAGLIYIGIRKVAGETISWKMVFEGFPVAGKLIVVSILQTLLIFIGFLLLILPGIYLAIGYAMTLPLIVDKKMSPWQAMEASRMAIHGEWWKIFGLSIVMGLILIVSCLPLGIGLIWTWPMFVVLGGVVYRSLFGIEKRFR